MEYKLSAKNKHAKWWTYGYFKKNQYGNLQASFKVTPELLELLQSKEGGYVNFAAFEDEGKKPEQHSAKESYDAPDNTRDSLDDDIPFALLLPLLGISSLALTIFYGVSNVAQGIIG